MTKMCLFYESPSGHARSDPIINDSCTSSHVHTFYGPKVFHPSTTYEDLINTPNSQSTSPVNENKSLYWHPSFYQVVGGTYNRVSNLDSSPYYRWDKSVVSLYDQDANKEYPAVEAFPPGFRMIAASTDIGADGCGLDGECTEDSMHAMFTEGCNYSNNDEEQCVSYDGQFVLPTQAYAFVGISLNMPTCWNGELDSVDHKSHMRYTLNGQVAGPCPSSHPRRVPQVQLFVRITNYQGGTYELADGKTSFHVDFFNGWEPGVLQTIIDNCAPQEQEMGEFNPPCDCTPETADDTQTYTDTPLTINENVAELQVCDADVKRLIADEDIDVTDNLPRYTESCQGASMVPRTWALGELPSFSTDCNNPITTTSTSSTVGSTSTTSSIASKLTVLYHVFLSSVYPNRLLFVYSASTTTESPPTTTIQSTTTSSTVVTTSSTSTTQSTTSLTTTEPPEPECVDSPYKMIHGRKEKYRSAKWVADRAGRLCSRNSIASHFPLTCNRCDDFACEDSRKWFVDSNTDEWYLCEEGWENPAIEGEICNLEGGPETCRELCGYCD